ICSPMKELLFLKGYWVTFSKVILILKIGQTGKTCLPNIEIPDVDVKNFLASIPRHRMSHDRDND
ncbi:MAG: hypothetical protein LLG93_02725, partial [Deltaproteobacteria bacterium]|nr:hypothetical protein [Deltaproteobacteria bacterium]